MSGSRTSFWDRITEISETIDSKSYYELLGVVQDALPADIESAYYKLIPRIHPDRHARQRDPLRKKALIAVYTRVGEAYRVLSVPVARTAYDATLAGGQTRITDESLRRDTSTGPDPKTQRARDLYAQGKQLLERGDESAARASWQLAHQFERDSKVIKAALDALSGDKPEPPPASEPPPAPEPPPVPEPEPPREHVRHPVARPVKVGCDSWKTLETLYTRDISRGGMFLRTTSPPAVGTRLDIVLRLPDGRTFELAAKVARAVGPGEDGGGPAGIGVRFEDTSAEALAELDAIVGRLDDRDESEVLGELIEELIRLRTASPNDALGVAADADPDIVQQAYRRLEKKFHPELYGEYREDRIRAAAEEVRTAMKTAYDALSAPLVPASPEATLGLQALNKGDFHDASVLLAGAVNEAPQDKRLRAAYHAASGHVARAAGDTALANKHFDTALVFDPQCDAAMRALRSEEP